MNFLISIGILFSSNIFAKAHPFESTHLKTLGGSGVGSVLLEESAFLNPASSSFFKESIIFAQFDKLSTTDNLNNSYAKQSSKGFVLAQGDPSLGGTFSFIDQKENNLIRKTFGVSMASPVAQASSGGFSVKSIKETEISKSITKKYYQTSFGVTHVLTDDTTLGILLSDPFKSQAHETQLLVGVHRKLVSYIDGVLDVGANYTANEISKTLLIRGGIQVRVLDDIFIRAGGFNNKELKESGEGYGIAWVMPRLSFEFALKNTKNTSSPNQALTYKETSFSLSLRGF